MRAVLRTAGERTEVSCAHRWLGRVLDEGTAGERVPDDGQPADVRIMVEDTAAPFRTAGWELLTRGAWRRPGQVIVRDACSSGLDLLVTADGPTLDITARWRPPVTGRAASAVLRARARLLIRAVLLQYPALWWSQQRGRVPLHASVCTLREDGPCGHPGGRTVLIAGPGGIGKSTLVDAELAEGASAATDNLCVSDGRTAWGLLEPRRVPARPPGGPRTGRPGRPGRRMPHGRREAPWPDRRDSLVPGVVLVLRRGTGPAATVAPCPAADAARYLVAGTYMAGELRRYWSFAATLALGTGVGEIHPPVERIARTLTAALPSQEIRLGRAPTALSALLAAASQPAATDGLEVGG